MYWEAGIGTAGKVNGAGFKDAVGVQKSDPQGLKPASLADLSGTAKKAVPFPKTCYETNSRAFLVLKMSKQ